MTTWTLGEKKTPRDGSHGVYILDYCVDGSTICTVGERKGRLAGLSSTFTDALELYQQVFDLWSAFIIIWGVSHDRTDRT